MLGVLLITVVGGILLGLLLDQPFWGQGIVRVLVIAPFFVMPTVSALVWKNMFMNPVNGLFAYVAKALGMQPYEFLSHSPLASIILIVAWQWLPFATLILLTALQSLDREQLDAAEMDGAGPLVAVFPHHAAASVARHYRGDPDPDDLSVVGLCGNSGHHQWRTGQRIDQPDLSRSMRNRCCNIDVGGGSAGGVVAIVLANIVAIFLMRMIGKNLEN